MKCRILTLIIAFIACLPVWSNVMCGRPQFYNGNCFSSEDIKYVDNSPLPFNVGFNYCVTVAKIDPSKQLESIIIPDSITIEGIKFKVIGIDENAFKNHKTLKNITFGKNIKDIHNRAFYGCVALSEIKIPATLTYISDNAFDSCISLTKFIVDPQNKNFSSFNNVLYNKDKTLLVKVPEAVYGSIVIPSTVSRIESGAFKDCKGITNVDLPSSVIEISYNSFRGCTNLTSVNLPNSITEIQASAFEGCANLTSINLPNSITEIGESAFEGCTNLTDIKLPDNLKTIWNNAFSKSGITSITIPLNLTLISDGSFSECKNLRTITFHANIRTCSPTALLGCKNLISINVDPQNKYFSSQDGVLYNKDKTKLICFPGGYEGHFTIPSTVTCIGKNAFYKCQKLTDITIPKSVTTIEENAFRECTGLTKIKIPKNVVEFGTTAFLDCINADIEIDNPNYKVRQKKFVFNRCKSVKWKK